MAGDENSECLICQETLLDKTVGALRCGHVYHRDCVVKWIVSSKAECPQCKMMNRIEDVRTLEFDLKPVPAQSPEELRRLEAATLEERERRREELCVEKAEAEAVAARVDAELELLRNLAQDRKRKRREVEQDSIGCQEELADLSEEILKKKAACAVIQAGLDAEARVVRKLPINPPRDGDHDLREERRKLRGGCRPAERTRHLHEALVSAIQQENEKMRDKNQREVALKRAEDELRDLRHLDVQLRRDLDERRNSSQASTPRPRWDDPSSQVSSQPASLAASQGSTVPPPSSASPHTAQAAASTPHTDAVSSSTEQSGSTSLTVPGAAATPGVVRVVRSSAGQSTLRTNLREVAVEVATPLKCRAQPEDDDEDMNMVYGGAPLRRSGSGGLSSRGAVPSRTMGTLLPAGTNAGVKTGGSKFGALFAPSGKPSPAPAVASVPTRTLPQTTVKTSMKSLFANRRI